ncbi:transposase [Streptomyces sp. NPDC059454]|uniref:transposase n=1 Tax=Streptomyces sp. NPDC059454 TaxID=3346836 RepID=UPI0036A1B01F
MRHPQGGGLTAERRAFRERIRMEAAGMFAAGQANADAATPVHEADARDFAEAVGGRNQEDAARPLSELGAAERANAVG